MKILGISAYYHDAAAAFVQDGSVVFAAQEERYSRKKNDASFPKQAIVAGFKHTHWEFSDLDAVVFYDKPFLKFERLLETHLRNTPKGLMQFVASIPAWLKQKLFIKRELKEALNEIGAMDWKKTKLLFSEHHVSHAASAFYPSPFKDAAILTIDGVGEYATASIAKGEGHELTMLKELHFPDSLGLLYSSFTYFLGFKVNEGEYKVMGLAPYTSRNDVLFLDYVTRIKEELVAIYEDGSIALNPKYFAYQTSLRMVRDKKFERLFGFKRREPNEALNKNHMALAAALQAITEEVVLKMAEHAKEITQAKHLCMAGGVALNCVANGLLNEQNLFDELFIQPAAGDSGGALGAALAAYHMHFEKERTLHKPDGMYNSRLGEEHSSREIAALLERSDIKAKTYSEEELIDKVTDWIRNGKVVGWFQGRMEYGPRALGGRSILANPQDKDMQYKLNMKVKKRESFRPFAPVMLQEEFSRFFGESYRSPYMLTVHTIAEDYRKTPSKAPASMLERVKQVRSVLPAVTHVDYSSRIQTVDEWGDEKLRKLLLAMKEKTGYGVLINTSFNINKEPIVCSPKDALNCFEKTDIDILVLNEFVILKDDGDN